MKRFDALWNWSFVSGLFVTDGGDPKGPTIRIVDGRSNNVIVPDLVKGSNHKVAKIAMSKASGDKFKGEGLERVGDIVAVGNGDIIIKKKGFGIGVLKVWNGGNIAAKTWCRGSS